MGMPLSLKLLITPQERRRRRHKLILQARNGSITSRSKAKKDSARAASVSRTFLRSWRCRPNLILTKETLCLKEYVSGEGDIARALTHKIDQILKNHSGTGVKTLELDLSECCDLDACYLNNWLQVAITPVIENFTFSPSSKCQEEYSLPRSLLFGQNGGSIQYLHLTCCAFHPRLTLVA
uniref:At1g61320/AtMIF1 LRR domain-containing protein n=1 Tax=Setaria viridis TaxID=4556 RepID=A0A4U6WHB6_SETVI|nr:hypothetical protein SEVIR_1G041800v2 [Setaria viridis]